MAPRIPVARTVGALRRIVAGYRRAGESVALVPTMGALHAGHLALVARAQKQADRVVVSIFVNPTQFAPTEDFSTYPRTFKSDCAALAKAWADLVWAPGSATVMYPPGFSTRIMPAGPAVAGLEDRFRPHFFGGVATVVAKLLLQCGSDFAMFGEKDFQQLRVVERMVADLDIATRIVPVATVRERDGLALSSRNVKLTPDERARAPVLYRALTQCAVDIRGGRRIATALQRGRTAIARAGFVLDYLEARHGRTLLPVRDLAEGPVRLLVAARIGSVRLIDNRPV
jgi:pantoate--beta-alanine ligase